MASAQALGVFFGSLETRNYYEVLNVTRSANGADIKAAFHDFSLRYHPDSHVGSPADVISLAAEIYKRGVEAYRCLSRPNSREKYERALGRGKLRLEPSHVSLAPPPPPPRTLEVVAGTPRGKQHARKADRLIAIGSLDGARVELVTACQCEPNNEELAERLQVLYEALALEPL